MGVCSARAAKAFPALGEFGLEAGEAEANREAIAVGRQPRVVMLEQVQPLGGPLNGVVRATQLVLPPPRLKNTRALSGFVSQPMDPLGEPYVAFVLFQV